MSKFEHTTGCLVAPSSDPQFALLVKDEKVTILAKPRLVDIAANLEAALPRGKQLIRPADPRAPEHLSKDHRTKSRSNKKGHRCLSTTYVSNCPVKAFMYAKLAIGCRFVQMVQEASDVEHAGLGAMATP